MKLASRPALAAASMLLCLSLGATACSDDGGGSESESQPPLPSGEPATFQVETRTTLGRVTGRLSKTGEKKVVGAISPVVQRWLDAAYGGKYPRSNFSDAFPGFTAGAQRDARHDRDMMSNGDIGDRIDGVTLKASRVWVDVLAVRRHAVAVTARFEVAFKTHGKLERRVSVRGRLMLTRSKPGWRIFGYHVAKNGVNA